MSTLARGAEARPAAGGAVRVDVRLRALYQVSNVLARFGSVQPTLFAVLDIVQRALSLRSTILILDAGHSRRTLAWCADGVNPAWMRASKARAKAAYAHLAGPAKQRQTDDEPGRAPAVLLPVAVQSGPVFGVLQIERAEPFDEVDVIFARAVVNQLALAVDRYVAIDARGASARGIRGHAERRRVKQLPPGREDEAREQEHQVGRQAAAVEARAHADQRCAAAEALQQRHEALVDNLDRAFVWEADAETHRVSYMSRRVEALLGFPRQRWLDEHDLWMSCVHPRDRRAFAQTITAALRDGADERCEHRCITADGRVSWFRTGVHVAQRGRRVWLQGVSIDMTATKEAERRVQAQLDFTRAVTDSLGEGVIAVDLEGRVTLYNPAAARLFGWKPEDVLGRPVAGVVQVRAADGAPTPERGAPFEGALRRGEQASSEEWSFCGKAGRPFPVSHSSAPLKREGLISGAVLAFQDITERKQTQRALQGAVEQANRAARDREDLLAVVSHDLKNPLDVILMAVASMAKRAQASSRRLPRSRLRAILRSAERMNRLTQNLLDSASVDAGKLFIEPQLTTVASLVEDAIAALRPLAAAKALAIVSDLAPGATRVWADASRLQQVFANLLGNALDFTPRGGSITLRVVPAGDRVQFTVADTGSGIAEEDLPHLFDRFWQSRGTARPGSGLGLSIVKGIVLAHGGQVWVTSTLGAGSAFCFTLRGA